MPKYILYCTQEIAPTVSASGTLSCDGGVSAIQVGTFDAMASAPELETVAQVWAAAFSMVLVCYVIARCIGVVLQMIREA